MRKLNEKLPGSRYVEIPGAGHISNMDRPAEFNRAIREFLRRKLRDQALCVDFERGSVRHVFSVGHASPHAVLTPLQTTGRATIPAGKGKPPNNVDRR